MSLLRLRCTLVLAALAGVCAGCPASEDEGGEDAIDDAGDEAGASETGEDEPIPGDACVDTPLAPQAPASVTATLRDASTDPAGIGHACGLTGPTLFFRVSVPSRADLTVSAQGVGFEPRVAVLAPGCVPEAADPSRLLACGEGLPVTIDDIGPAVDLLVAVGVDVDDPALVDDADETGTADESESGESGSADPLAFTLELDLRSVLGEGSSCGPGLGRCEGGTLCLPDDGEGEDGGEDGGEDDGDRCRRPPADSCVEPGLIELSVGVIAPLSIPVDELHSDAHEHACAGWRRPERVDRLRLPPELSAAARLQVTSGDPRVGLAIRAPGCGLEDARACAPSGAALDWGQPGELAALAEAGVEPLLFVELPRERDAEEAPIAVSVALVED